MDYIFVPKESEPEKLFTSHRHINVTAHYHVNYEMEFVIVTRGTVTMKIRNEEYRIESGHACYVMPFEPHSFDTAEYSECHVLMFSSNLIKHFFGFLAYNKPDSKCFELSSEIITLIDKILPHEKNSADTVDALACLAPICSEIKRKCTFTEKQNQYDDIFLQALRIANECYTSQITLSSVAKRIGINPATLSRKFAHNAKINFNTYINSLRCHYAATLILETNSTFTEIAYLAGFGSIRNFNRIFSRQMNCTPTEFKNNPSELNNRIHI